MHCGSSRRPPRRTALAGRLALLCALLVLAFGSSAGPATAYSCGATSQSVRTLAGHRAEKKDCEQEPASPAKRANADAMSFVFFIGILIGVVLVPAALGHREEPPPE
jgi:hypothetical protein